MEKIVLQGRKVVGGKAEGEAIVTDTPLCFFPLMDRLTGTVTDTGHPLYGRSLAGKILGSTGSTYAIYDMVTMKKSGPEALIMMQAEPISTIGAIMAEIPVVDAFDQEPWQVISDGDYLEVDGDAGTVTITKQK